MFTNQEMSVLRWCSVYTVAAHTHLSCNSAIDEPLMHSNKLINIHDL